MPNNFWRRPGTMPMDAYRHEGNLVINFDLPGIAADTLDLTVEKNVLTVNAQRPRPQFEGAAWLASERPYGTFTCQLSLGDGVDVESLSADYDGGVLTITVPVVEPASRKIEVSRGGGSPESIETPQAA